jgi:hypothetical protein
MSAAEGVMAIEDMDMEDMEDTMETPGGNTDAVAVPVAAVVVEPKHVVL